ncbi:hypothetical protein [Intestinibacter bartlettii]|uniref:hypothetical protein n=1 Tax=Intestinibacter bartlettii TaxID=261299 RepID=UPI003AB82365
MSLRTMLEDNGYTYLSKEYKEVEKDFRKMSNWIVQMRNGIKPCNDMYVIKILNILENHNNIKGDYGNNDLHDIKTFLKKAVCIFNAKFIIRQLGYNFEFNPKKYGNDKKELKQHIELLKEIKYK